MQRQRWKPIFRCASWGAFAALALAVATYVVVVHVANDPPGLDGDRYMAASLILGTLGAPLSFVLFEQIGEASVSAVLYYAAYLAPIAINGAVLGILLGALLRRFRGSHQKASA